MTSSSGLARQVAGYAARFNERFGGAHDVASPLGAWLLLALTGPAVRGPGRNELEALLGIDVEVAAEQARALLEQPHPAVRAAVALWAREARLLPEFGAWASGLPQAVEHGPIPAPEHADAWARERTGGMVQRFPLEPGPDTLLVLASALATDISWSAPLASAPAEQLGGEFGARISRCLTSAAGARQGVFDTEAAGRVAVHAIESSSGVLVVSVIGEPARSASEVLAGAHQLAPVIADSSTAEGARAVDLFDLPLGDGHAWSLSEEMEYRIAAPGSVATRCTSYLPAWSVSGDHDLTAAAGVPEVFDALARFARPEEQPARLEAQQSVTASYTRTGFRAAAATAFATVAGSAPPPMATVRTRVATLRFNRPHAVLALAMGDGPWHGVPVVNAWIAEPDETSE